MMDNYHDGGHDGAFPHVNVFNITIIIGNKTIRCEVILFYGDDLLEVRMEVEEDGQDTLRIMFFTEEVHNDIFYMICEILETISNFTREPNT